MKSAYIVNFHDLRRFLQYALYMSIHYEIEFVYTTASYVSKGFISTSLEPDANATTPLWLMEPAGTETQGNCNLN